MERFAYGSDPSQVADLHRPEGRSKGVVVVIHGGFWRARYDAGLGRPLAVDLAARGWTAWNLEYRRVGNGGGYPATLDDVHAGIDRLADIKDDAGPVITLGHSAGGHLATWAAARHRFPRWEGGLRVTGVISQAGVLDLASAHRDRLGSGAVEDFLGAASEEDWGQVDPARQLPLEVPVVCVHAVGDDVVPIRQSEEYVAAATAAGAVARLETVDGDHFTVIDVTDAAWRRTLEVLHELG